jgi:uncharacterized membrane protein
MDREREVSRSPHAWRARLTQDADLLLTTGLAAAASALLIYTDWQGVLRISVSATFFLLLPGYAVTCALFPRRADIDASERLALSLALSVVTVVLTSLLLEVSPWEISLVPLALALLGATGLGCLLALVRRAHTPADERFYLSRYVSAFWSATLVLSGVVAVVGGVQLLLPETNFTEFYVLGRTGRLEHYPRALAPGEAFSVTLGVANHEGRVQHYLLELPSAEQEERLRVPPLQNGEVWEEAVQLQAPREEGRQGLPFRLYRPGERAPYRSLSLHVEVSGPASNAVR